MKFALLVSMAFVYAECQYYNNYFSPKLSNPLMYNVRGFHDPYSWLTMPEDQQGDVFIVQSDQSNDEQTEGRTRFGANVQPQDQVLPRFFFNQGTNNVAIYRPQAGFNRKTLLYTTTATKTILVSTQCIPASLVLANAGQCARRRRDVAALIEQAIESLDPTPTETVEVTAVPSAADLAPSDSISSSKAEDDHAIKSDSESFERAKRFFFMATASTFTELSFSTSTFTQRVQLRFATVACPGGATACLACIPAGFSTC